VKEICFAVQGSEEEPYEVTFIKRSDTKLSAYCTCPAGEHGQYCKHRFRILDGLTDGIVSNNLHEVKEVNAWLPGTDVEIALIKMRELAAEAERIKKALQKAKKEMAKAFLD
jgi:uncharacterized Zn finger protein